MVEKFFRQLYVAVLGLIPIAVGVWGKAAPARVLLYSRGLIPTAVGVWGEAAPARVLLYSRGLIPTDVGGSASRVKHNEASKG